MAQTLRQILDDIAAWIDQDTTIASGADLTVRVNLANQSLREWGDAYQWKQLRVPATLSFTLSGTSVGLPANFKKLMSPVYDVSRSANNDYEEIDPEERFTKLATDRYCYTIGDEVIGKALVINPAMGSGVSLNYDYQSFPSSMATLQDVCVCPHPEFVTKRTLGMLLESRSDPRFPQLKADADSLLKTMIEEEDAPSGGANNRLDDWARKAHFRIGRD